MHRARLPLLAFVAGCGRVDFDPARDATVITGHDEDGDGIPDSIDPCPHVPSDRTDTDGDGVGDTCDPNPNTPSEHWLRFATMQPGDQPFDDASAFTQTADTLHVAGDATPNITGTFGSVRIDIGFVINGFTANTQHQIAAGVDAPGVTEYYFGEMNQDVSSLDVSIIQYDIPNGYTTLSPTPFPGIHAGSGTFLLDANIAARSHHLVVGWPNELYTSDAATTAYAGGTLMRFAFNGLDIDLRYLAIIATQ